MPIEDAGGNSLDDLIKGLQRIRDAYRFFDKVMVEGSLSIWSEQVFPPEVEGLPVEFRQTVNVWWWEQGCVVTKQGEP